VVAIQYIHTYKYKEKQQTRKKQGKKMLVSHLLIYCSESDITGSYNFTEVI